MSGPAQLYVDYLRTEGFQPSIDGDGDVVFKHEGGTYYVGIETEDPGYFRLVFANFWSVDDSDELARVTAAAAHATMLTKVAKVYLRRDGKDTVAAVEMFLPKPEDFRAVFPRALSALRASIAHFREKMA